MVIVDNSNDILILIRLNTYRKKGSEVVRTSEIFPQREKKTKAHLKIGPPNQEYHFDHQISSI